MLTSLEIRRKYLEFFAAKGHAVIPSASLVPQDDPTVLFTTAGMHPLVPYLSGQPHPLGKRLVSCQKCIRTVDIDNVGDDTHLTLFEMLGNWSLGDYFKDEAIRMSFVFLTDPKWLGIPLEKLAVSVFAGDQDAPRDEEAAQIWRELGVPVHKIVYLPKKDNWWGPAGLTGPCGPDTEMFYFVGEGLPPEESNPDNDSAHWVEIWNDVFMQYHKSENGSYEPLSQTNVDTGMGLERVAAILQSKTSVFDSDVFRPFIEFILAALKVTDEHDPRVKRSVRIIADHVRAATFIIADGVKPSNLQRGYVLRRLIRRAIAQCRLLGSEQTVLKRFAERVIAQYRDHYPELKINRDKILDIIANEEAVFGRTLDRGMKELEKLITGGRSISGVDAFTLHDTYGFPIDLTREFAAERGVTVDLAGFEKEFAKQQDRSRAGSGFTLGKTFEVDYATTPVSEFVGYDSLESVANVIQLKDAEGEAQLVLDKTPFYAESGGQAGDMGVIAGATGKLIVKTTKKTKRGVHIHLGTLEGKLSVGEQVTATVDAPSRAQIARYHTATHLLHWALREVLGKQVEQKGSSITKDRLRFDFSFDRALTPEELEKVQTLVAQKVSQDLSVVVNYMTLEEAKNQGTLALFEGKYGNRVRVLNVGDGLSVELCGGTHVSRTGAIGQVKIDKQEAVAGGIRRIRMK